MHPPFALSDFALLLSVPSLLTLSLLQEGGVFTKDSELWFAIQLIAAALTKEM